MISVKSAFREPCTLHLIFHLFNIIFCHLFKTRANPEQIRKFKKVKHKAFQQTSHLHKPCFTFCKLETTKQK